MPLNKYKGRPEAEICKGCDKLPTKPKLLKEHLMGHAVTAVDLSILQRAGATFSYPHALSAAEWASLSGLTSGQDQAERLRQERMRDETTTKPRKRKRNG